MSHNRDLSAAAAQLGFHSSNIGIGTDNPGTKLDVRGGNWSNGDIVVGQSGNAGRVKFRRGADGSDTGSIGFAAADNNSRLVINVASGDGTIAFQTNSVERLRIDNGGRLGLGVVPEAFHSNNKAVIRGDSGYTILGRGDNSLNISQNFYYDSSDAGKYIANGEASLYNQSDGSHSFYSAASGSANAGASMVERLRITSAGNVGINIANPDRRLEVVETASSLTYPVAVSNHTDASAGVGAGIAFHLTAGGNSRGELGVVYAGNSNSDGTDFVFKPNDGSTGNIERLRITNDGKFGFNTTNPGAFDSGANHLVLLGNTSGTGNAGITIASGTSSYGNIYFADGTSGADAYRGHIAYNHNGNTMRFATNGSERMRILSSGFVNIGGYLTSVSNSGLHVGRGSGGTAAGESVLAATLGDYSTMVSALLTVKNAGNRGSQGHTGGSPLAKFEFNNGTAFEIDKYGRRTLPFQPAFNCKLSTATGANFTGFLVFNSVSYNIGNHYNSSNGRFTAPVDGRYLFTWYTNVEKGGSAGVIWGDWYVNGNARGNRFYTRWDGNWELIGGTIILDLDTNDYVQVYAATSGNWDGGSYGSYSGCLLG